jgi:hypothetical protein
LSASGKPLIALLMEKQALGGGMDPGGDVNHC